MNQFDLLYMPSNTLYGNKYKYTLSGIDVASRHKVARPMRTKHAKDVAEMIADIYKVGSSLIPRYFKATIAVSSKERLLNSWKSMKLRFGE